MTPLPFFARRRAESRPRRWQSGTRRRIALVVAGVLAAAGLSTVSASPAFAAVSCQVDYTLRTAWSTGFTADLTLRNLGDALNGWTLTFDFPGNQQISSPPWNAGTWSQTGTRVSMSNASWNGSVASGGIVSGVGFNATFSGTNANPTNFAINGVTCTGQPPTSPQLVVTPTTVALNAGGTATYGVHLSSAPTANVTVASARTAGATCITVSGGASLTFTPTNWNTDQTVTLAAATGCSGSATVGVSGTGLTTVNVTANSTVPSTQSLVVTPTNVSLTAGSNATYSVRLGIQPTGNVTVASARTTGQTCITVASGGSLTFTTANWNTPQTVTLSAAAACSGTANIAVTSTGLTTVNVTATSTVPATQSLVVTPTSLSVSAGSTASYAVRLNVAPTANVTVASARTTGPTCVTVSSGASLTFTPANWNVTQTVVLAAAAGCTGAANIAVSSTGLTTVNVTATAVTQSTYVSEFLTQYNKIKAPGSGYFSPEGVPYHSVETFMIEAPDHGHETTSEAYSFYVWLEAMYGRVTGDWSRFNAAWQNLETYIIPTQQTLNYNPAKPATYAPEFGQPSQYPSPLDTGVTAGSDPLYAELQSTYGNASIYGMHWLLDVDNVYGYGAKVAANSACNDSTVRVVAINTYQRGPQESVWETVAHPSCETFGWGSANGFLPLFIQDSAYAQQWRYTDAPDADARAVEAAYWALTWATAAGQQSQVTATVAKAAKMGDYLRYSFYDKYFKQPGCTSPSCPAGTGKNSSNYLLSWYYAWGGGIGASWSWRIGSSHNHGGYQNPLAAWALSSAGPTAIRPTSPTAAADWSTSLTRQLDFMTWLQSAEGGIAGGATNSWDGAYANPPSNLPKFYGMAYDFQPVYHDPPSNQWFGFQAWGMSRVAEYYAVTGDAKAKAILDKWVNWAVTNTTLGSNGAYQIPSTLSWTGTPAASYSGTGTIAANTGLHVSIVDYTNDVGVTAALARTLTSYASRAGATSGLGLQAKNTAKGLLDRLLLRKDSIGISQPETRTDYNRLDDIWSSSNQQGLYIPSTFTGTMPNGDVIAAGKSFLDTRSFLKNDPAWPQVQSYLNGGAAPVFTYHRFWAQSDFALALADFGYMFPNG